MEIVRDESGEQHLLLERSGASSRLCDLRTGEQREVRTEEIEPAEEPALLAAGRAVPSATREELPALGDDRTVGLLGEIERREPVGVRLLLEDYGLCESDLHGMVGELRAAGLVEPVEPTDLDALAASDRGYRTTEATRAVFSAHRSGTDRGNGDGNGDDGET